MGLDVLSAGGARAHIARDTGWGYDWVIAGASVGLLVAGIVSPRVGRYISSHGGRPVLAGGALLLAAGLAGVGLAPNYPLYLVAWAIVGAGMGAGLYDAAFSTLGNIYGSNARGPITSVTLFGGFASTVCWPLSAWLAHGSAGAKPASSMRRSSSCCRCRSSCLRCRAGGDCDASQPKPAAVRLRPGEHAVFAILAAVVTIAADDPGDRRHAPAAAVAGARRGPRRRGGLGDDHRAGAGRRPRGRNARRAQYHPVWTMIASAVLVAVAAVMLFPGFPLLALAIALYGAGNGIGTVARGSLPLALFGADRYPVLMGRLALPILIAMAVSPYLGGVAFQHGGADWALGLLAGLALVNVTLVGALRLSLARKTD